MKFGENVRNIKDFIGYHATSGDSTILREHKKILVVPGGTMELPSVSEDLVSIKGILGPQGYFREFAVDSIGLPGSRGVPENVREYTCELYIPLF